MFRFDRVKYRDPKGSCDALQQKRICGQPSRRIVKQRHGPPSALSILILGSLGSCKNKSLGPLAFKTMEPIGVVVSPKDLAGEPWREMKIDYIGIKGLVLQVVSSLSKFDG